MAGFKRTSWRRRTAGNDGEARSEKSNPSAIIVVPGSSSASSLRGHSLSKSVDGMQALQPPPETSFDRIDSPLAMNNPSSHPPRQAEWLPVAPKSNGLESLEDLRLDQEPEIPGAESKAHTRTSLDQDERPTISPVEERNSYRDRNKARRKLVDTFTRLTDKREQVLPLRLQLHDIRTSLKYRRTALNSLDGQLIQKMRVLFSKDMSPDVKSLLDDFAALQDARDQLQPEEDDYDKLEDLLIRKEWDLQEAELRIYGGGASAQISILGDEELAILEETFEDTESTLSTHSGPAENTQQFNKYLSRKGDANIVRERINGLRAERAQLIDEEIMRARIGMTLDEPSRAFLAEFDANHAALQQELTQIEEDILRLKEALTDHDGILFSTDQFDGSPWQIVDYFMSDLMPTPSLEADGGVDPTNAGPSIDNPLLLPVLPVEEHSKPVFSDNSAGVSKGFLSTANFINEWLLHRLRISLHEVQLFISIGDIQRLNLSPERLKDLVLEWWFKDQSADIFASVRKAAAQSANVSIQTTPGQIQARRTKSDSDFPLLRQTLLLAHRDKSPTLRNSDSAFPA